MTMQNGQSLDFLNLELQEWLEACPFQIRNLRQLMFEPKHQKEVELVVEVPIEKTAVNFKYYGMTLGAKTKELEDRYTELDKEYKQLIVAEVRERNPVKLLALEDRTSKVYKEMRAITQKLRDIIEAEKTGV
ncbi:hypothetical protein CPAG_00019 [Prochlorococcus phage MED4-184]|uniref:hypothetical protein n=1 Tax=Prochlorococcus phage MED4-184 TaxID=889955 RepID=UPI0002C0D49A|nr:hypothetical protein CPAG_00019 [Prochlorococcus phage MED4-184]AGH26987.1 hypothetical protein CPAG_00019 [Prochlorococcus phage MED4-184]QKN88288.1 hypothetical protein P-HS2_00019 [Prochlorococcus phage P-HS2]|tara:strand:- start:79 stop:474 length:396 start_codon:yes stop_codon:yes gene_type:complete